MSEILKIKFSFFEERLSMQVKEMPEKLRHSLGKDLVLFRDFENKITIYSQNCPAIYINTMDIPEWDSIFLRGSNRAADFTPHTVSLYGRNKRVFQEFVSRVKAAISKFSNDENPTETLEIGENGGITFTWKVRSTKKSHPLTTIFN